MGSAVARRRSPRGRPPKTVPRAGNFKPHWGLTVTATGGNLMVGLSGRPPICSLPRRAVLRRSAANPLLVDVEFGSSAPQGGRS